MTYEEMASDAGYRGDEARQVAAALEARDQAWAEEVWAAEQEALAQAEIEEERMSEKLSEQMQRECVSEGLGYIERVAALEASLLQANVKLEAMKLLLEECRAAIASVPDKIVFGVGGDGTTYW
jgi:hypothetical protein